MVEACIQLRRTRRITLGVEVRGDLTESWNICARRSLGGACCDRRLKRLTEVEQLKYPSLSFGEAADHRPGEVRVMARTNLSATTLSTAHQTLQGELEDRLSDKPSRHSQRLCELAF